MRPCCTLSSSAATSLCACCTARDERDWSRFACRSNSFLAAANLFTSACIFSRARSLAVSSSLVAAPCAKSRVKESWFRCKRSRSACAFAKSPLMRAASSVRPPALATRRSSSRAQESRLGGGQLRGRILYVQLEQELAFLDVLALQYVHLGHKGVQLRAHGNRCDGFHLAIAADGGNNVAPHRRRRRYLCHRLAAR